MSFQKGYVPWNKGVPTSEETKTKMRASASRKPLSLETKKKLSEANKGRKFTEEHKEKLRLAKVGYSPTKNKFSKGLTPWNKGKHWSAEMKEKLSLAHMGQTGRPSSMKGKHHSEETKKKIGLGSKGRVSPMKGRTHSEETRKKISAAELGEKHFNWQGGKSFEPYTTDWTETLKKSVRERDHYICQICSQDGNDVHHIDYVKEHCNPDNLVTLCHSCHSKTNYNRQSWQNRLNDLMKAKGGY